MSLTHYSDIFVLCWRVVTALDSKACKKISSKTADVDASMATPFL